jgi:hypothetical protein
MELEEIILWQKAALEVRAYAFQKWDRGLQDFSELWWWALESEVEALR